MKMTAREKDELKRMLEEICEEYERARNLDYVRDPIGWALYCVWDRRQRLRQG